MPLNSKPWRHRWDRKQLRGVIYPQGKRYEYEKYMKSHSEFKPYERWDLMKHYRETVHDDDHSEVVREIEKFERDTQGKSHEASTSAKITRARKIPREDAATPK